MALNLSPETAFTDDQKETAPTPAPADLAPHFPQLEILECLGRGGMGVVYRARQPQLDRFVALKILAPERVNDPRFAERFQREAKALAKLSHPNIVSLHEFGQADGLFYFLMEFVDGMSLRHLLEVERISAREALAIVPQICDALQYAHDQGIVHRDIKPENILLDRQGRVKVADFGLAKLVGTDALALAHPMGEVGAAAPGEGTLPPATLTDAGKMMGTPQYMAPEQREYPTEVDHRADIYSLGVVFYQMLTGELPGKPIEAPSRKVHIDVRLDEVVLRALEKEPQRRYQQASQVKTAVETIAQSPTPDRPANSTDASPPRLLKGDAGFVSTPEQLGTFEGQLFLWHRRSQLLLDERQLTVSRAGVPTVIPLAAMRDVSIGHYRRVMHPMGLDLISVTYDADGQTKRLFFSPYESWFGLPSSFNRIVAEWFNAIRATVVAATGREPGNTPAEQLGVPPGSKALYALLLLPALLGGIFVIALVRRSTGADAAHAFLGGRWVIILGMLGFGFLALVLGRLFGGGPGSAGAKAAGRKWPTPVVGVRDGQRVIYWPGVAVFGGVLAAAVLIGVVAMSLAGFRSSYGLYVALMLPFILLPFKVLGEWGRSIEQLPRLDGPKAGESSSDSAQPLAALEVIRREVKGPAIGLLITAILNCLLIPLVFIVRVWLHSSRPSVPGEMPFLPIPLLVITPLLLCAFIIYAALKMMRLEARGAALVASVLAILVTPGNIIGLPLGIWALVTLNQRGVRAAFAGDPTALVSGLRLSARPHPVWPWVVAAVGMISLVPVVLMALFLLARESSKVEAVRQAAQAADQARSAAAKSPNRVLEVRCEGPKAYIRADLDDLHDLHLFIGGDALGWSTRWSGSTSVTATVEASVQIKLEDGSLGHGLIFQAWSTRHHIAITPDGPVPYGEVVFRTDSRITSENGTFTFADIRQTNGTLIPVSIRVRPVSGTSSVSHQTAPVPRAPKDIAPARFEASVYELQLPENRTADLDEQALEAQAETLQDLEKALEKSGKAKLLHKVDQKVNLDEDTIVLATREPVTTGTHKTALGSTINMVTYQELGLMVSFSGSTPAKDSQRKGPEVQVSFKLAALGEGGKEMPPGLKVPHIHNIEFSHSEVPRFGKPKVLLKVSPPGGGEKAQPVAFVVRYVFKEVLESSNWQGGLDTAPVIVDVKAANQSAAAQPGGPWTARLPSGATVELAGAGGDGRWWWPDGSPVAGSLYDQERIGVIGLEAVPSNEVRRVFLARLENHTGQSCGINYEVVPRSCLGGPQTVGSRTVTNGVTVLPFEAWVPATNRTVTVQVGVSCGPWEDVASKEYDEYGQEHGGSRRTSGNLSRAIETKDAVVIMSQDRWPADEVRVAAVRVDGQLIEAGLKFESDTDGRQLTATFHGLTLKQLKEIKLQHRPYTWVEFRNVSLQARHSTEVQVSPVSSSQPSAFGPVIERVIATPDADDKGLVFFDLETGKSFKPPFPLTFHPNRGPAFVELTPELKQWIKARDVDVLLRLGEKTWNLMTLEMQDAFAGQLNEWETISPEKVIGIFAAKDAEHLVRDEVPASSSGQSYRDGFGSFNAFRTRSNTIGVYQFEGVDNSTRHGVGTRLRKQAKELSEQNAQIGFLKEENARLARAKVAEAELERFRSEQAELLRLRGQVRALQKQLADAHQQAATNRIRRVPASDPSAIAARGPVYKRTPENGMWATGCRHFMISLSRTMGNSRRTLIR